MAKRKHNFNAGPAALSPVVPLERTDLYAWVRHEQDLQQAQAASANVVFLGDSITAGLYEDLTVCPGDQDWYALSMGSNELIEIDLLPGAV